METGKSIVDLFDKFVSALGAIIEAYDLKSKGNDASLGEKASIEYQIDKKEIKVKELLTQINEALNNLETPILKEIGKEEKNIIEKLTLRLKAETELSFWDKILNKHGIAATLGAFFIAVIYGVTRYNSDPLMFYAVVAGILLYLIVIYLFKKR